ncbi:MAG: transcription initiation factor IIB [Thermoprotei archaeon]|nr:MAG: transcription initiation factor IIB [Thermoprotei archaeon]
MVDGEEVCLNRGEEEIVCPYCGSRKIVRDYERAEITCAVCGMVIADHLIDQGPEWRAFNEEQRAKRARTGSPISILKPDKGLTTDIDWRNKDSSGRSLDLNRRIQALRFRLWQQRIRAKDSLERNLQQALNEIKRLGSNMNIPPSVQETAAIIYRRALEKGYIRGRSIDSMAAACLYIAVRIHGLPRSLDEIASESRANKKEIGRSYRLLVKTDIVKVPPITIENYIPTLIRKLRLPSEIGRKATEILKVATSAGLTSGKGPKGLAAAAVYLASVMLNCKKTQREIAQAAGVTEVTIRNRFKELMEKLEFTLKV